MQRCIICKSFAVSLVFILFMLISLTAVSGSYNYQYTLQPAGGQYNPWVLPQTAENPMRFPQPPQYQNQGGFHQDRIYQNDRFVTPQFLESLKQQQSQHQMMPENARTPQFAPGQSMQQRPESRLPGPGSFGSPLFGMDYVDPLYDQPIVTPWSPWGIGSDNW